MEWPKWTRRDFLKSAGTWTGAGLLQPVLTLIESGKPIEAAYPQEVLSIEKYTKGKVKPGMIISKDNADLVKELAPEGLSVELKRGREIKIAETTTNLEEFVDKEYIAATHKHKGQAVLDKKGQLWTKEGKPWIGGDPFPEAKTGIEAMWNHVINYERQDDLLIPIMELDVDRDGTVVRRSSGIFVQIYTVARVGTSPQPYIPGHEQELLRNAVYQVEPFDVYGLAVGNITPYDASQLPETYAYIPTLRRTRRLPSTQRFEPSRPYATYYTSDFNIQNDPILTWSWKLVGRKPMLIPSPVNKGFFAPGKITKDDFVFPPTEEKFPRSTWELRPEVLVVEGIPQLAGAAYGKKIMYVDAIIRKAYCGDIYDKQGQIWKWIVFFMNRIKLLDGKEHAATAAVVFADLQKDYRTNIWERPEHGGIVYRTDSGLKIEEWLTPQAFLRRARR